MFNDMYLSVVILKRYRQMLRWSLILSLQLGGVVMAQTAQPTWNQAVEEVVESVVSLELAYQRALGGEGRGTSTATGFVVDAENGIILTNRHVVRTGPLTAHATFSNQERVRVTALYRDPVHDFGFLQYDPSSLKQPPKALRLRSDKLRLGLEIRVLGSDGGEQLSILSGTVAKLDRIAPRYGRYNYNDFNTFYIQAASSTSGGSSGAPVIDIDGDVVALNAGANTRTAASFYFPLPMIEDALAALQQDQMPVRAGLDAIFEYQAFADLVRLGLPEQQIAKSQQLAPAQMGCWSPDKSLPEAVLMASCKKVTFCSV